MLGLILVSLFKLSTGFSIFLEILFSDFSIIERKPSTFSTKFGFDDKIWSNLLNNSYESSALLIFSLFKYFLVVFLLVYFKSHIVIALLYCAGLETLFVFNFAKFKFGRFACEDTGFCRAEFSDVFCLDLGSFSVANALSNIFT